LVLPLSPVFWREISKPDHLNVLLSPPSFFVAFPDQFNANMVLYRPSFLFVFPPIHGATGKIVPLSLSLSSSSWLLSASHHTPETGPFSSLPSASFPGDFFPTPPGLKPLHADLFRFLGISRLGDRLFHRPHPLRWWPINCFQKFFFLLDYPDESALVWFTFD